MEASMFTYPDGQSYDSYQDVSFIPMFYTPDVTSDVQNVCGDNRECQYDYAMTGNPGLALSTKMLQDEAQSISNITHSGMQCKFISTNLKCAKCFHKKVNAKSHV